MAIVSNKLKGSSLIEVLTAMTILLVIMAMAASVYVRLSMLRPNRQLQLQNELKALAMESNHNKDFSRKQWNLEGSIQVYQRCEPYANDSILRLLELKAVSKTTGKEQAVYREIIMLPDSLGYEN